MPAEVIRDTILNLQRPGASPSPGPLRPHAPHRGPRRHRPEPKLMPTTTTVSLSAKFPYLSAGYNNTREWTRTATAVAPNGARRVARCGRCPCHPADRGGQAIGRGHGRRGHQGGRRARRAQRRLHAAHPGRRHQQVEGDGRRDRALHQRQADLPHQADRHRHARHLPHAGRPAHLERQRVRRLLRRARRGRLRRRALRRQAVVRQRRLELGVQPQRGHRPASREDGRLHLPLLRRLAFGAVRVDRDRARRRPGRAARAVLGGLLRRHLSRPGALPRKPRRRRPGLRHERLRRPR